MEFVNVTHSRPGFVLQNQTILVGFFSHLRKIPGRDSHLKRTRVLVVPEGLKSAFGTSEGVQSQKAPSGGFQDNFNGIEPPKYVLFKNWYILGVKKFQTTPTKQDLGTSDIRGSFQNF